MRINFEVKFDSVIGQNIYITGSSATLGKWDKEDALPLHYSNHNVWSIEIEHPAKPFEYQFFIKDERDGSITEEWTKRTFDNPSVRKKIYVKDTWYYPSLPEFNLSTHFFDVIGGIPISKRPKRFKKNTHRFSIGYRTLQDDHELCILGSHPNMGSWDTTQAIPMRWYIKGQWCLDLDLSNADEIFYKYLVRNKDTHEVIYFEEGENRYAPISWEADEFVVCNDVNFIQPKYTKWRGSGVAIPVFSLRSEKGCGVGEFLDLVEFGDWANDAGFSMVQILPIHDTIAKKDWTDSYPYAAISVYALHPMYLRLTELNYKLTTAETQEVKDKSAELNALEQVDYEAVLNFKFDFLQRYFNKHKAKILKNKKFNKFIQENESWLQPYAVFSVLRDTYGTAVFTDWEKHSSADQKLIDTYFDTKHKGYEKVMFYAYIQWQLHEQLLHAVISLHRNKITLKGDLPIGIYRYSVDAWWNPELFHMDQQAGAPPDDFAVLGQNWEFPTYNWDKMQEDYLAWWKSRFRFMSRYFDAFRIDHILGFFRIWQIPLSATQGILGRFEPALAVTLDELHHRGIYLDIDRLVAPYITYDLLQSYFDDEVDAIAREYFEVKNQEGGFMFKEQYATQRKIKDTLGEEHPHLSALLEIAANVLFIKEDHQDYLKLHPRFSMTETYSYKTLPWDAQNKLYALYTDYFYNRQEQFWLQRGQEKLPALKQATNMLTCGEDLGMVPKVVPKLMNDLAILSLQVQRMPSDDGVRFSHPSNAPYLSVVSPSSHDTSTLRQWWKENRDNAQYYYNNLIGWYGEAPHELSPMMLENIIDQHLFSPAMLSVIPLQEFLGIDSDLRNPNEDIERINIPAVFPHYWRYRMHLNISELQNAKDFTERLNHKHKNAGRG